MLTEEKIVSAINSIEEFSELYHAVASTEVRASRSSQEAKEALERLSYTIEAACIKEVGGDEKKVGATEAARQRVYSAAKSKSAAYQEANSFYLHTLQNYRYHKHMMRLLEFRGKYLIASTSPKD